jgi:[ribosomal protein S18]-alanine N-acetyltransferase
MSSVTSRSNCLPVVVRYRRMIDSELSLQLARLSDASEIAEMSRDFIEYGLSWRWTAKRVAASIAAPNVNVLVARLGRRIIGFAIMRYGDDDAHLDLLAVAPHYRRQGIAKQMLEWLEKCALIAGTFRIALEVRISNRAAQLFYQRMGYHPLSQLPDYYQGIEGALRMGRDLSRQTSNDGGL